MKTTRNAALDAAKGISLLSLPAIHSALIYGKTSIRNTLYGKILAFLAEYTGAPVFMMTMGMSMALGKEKSCRSIVWRSCKLLLSAYMLNALKFLVSGSLNMLSEKMFKDSGLPKGKEGLLELLKTGDILHLVAIACLVCGSVRRSGKYVIASVVLGLLVIFISPKIWKLKIHPLINGEPPKAFFPVFPWLAYPLIGLATGRLLTRDKSRDYLALGAIGMFCLLVSYALSKKEDEPLKENFYRLGPSATLHHTGFVFVLLGVCGIGRNKKLSGRPFKKLLFLLSKNVTANYMIQWVLIFWLLPVFGYAKCGTCKTFIAGILNTYLSIRLTGPCGKLKKRSN